jgi:chemotaxis signal transduction protein
MEQPLRSVLATRGLVTFTAGDGRYAAPVEEVAGLLDADRLAPLPGQSLPMAGVIAFRGSVVPVLDLAFALGAEESSAAPAYAVVLERGTDRFAILVRSMPRLVPSRDAQQRDLPPAAPVAEGEAPSSPGVLASYEIAGREVLGLDFWSLMDSIAPPAAFRLSGLDSEPRSAS